MRDVGSLDDEALLARDRALPVVRITPTDGSGPLIAGAFDPGGMGWLLPYGGSIALGILAVRRRSSTFDRSIRSAPPR